MNADLRQIAIALLVLSVGGLTGWAWAISERVSVVETEQRGTHSRIDSIENGRLIPPLAGEVIQRFNSVNNQIGDLANQLNRLATAQEALTRMLFDKRGELAPPANANKGG